MSKFERKYIVAIVLLLSFMACKKPYDPVVITKADSYLVVDGIINVSPGGITSILLSRTKSLTDTVVNIPEHGAAVSIQSSAGATYALQETGNNGEYISNALNLNKNDKYKIVISTSANNQYQSDLVAAKTTPAIDSVVWRQDTKGVNLYVNTHDPANNTRYYRWQFVQTWEYHSQVESPWGINNGVVYVRTAQQQVHICYTTTSSKNILLGNTAALAQDVISDGLLATFLQGDSTLTYRSSFLVKQFAMAPEAYFYWQIIKKNSEQLGTLFDLQPSQLEGNIHSLKNSNEPVVGFVSVSTAEEKRIFINNTDLQGWGNFNGNYNCQVIDYPPNPSNVLLVDYPDKSYVPWYYVMGGPLKMAKAECVDCTLSGGVTAKPSFW